MKYFPKNTHDITASDKIRAKRFKTVPKSVGGKKSKVVKVAVLQQCVGVSNRLLNSNCLSELWIIRSAKQNKKILEVLAACSLNSLVEC